MTDTKRQHTPGPWSRNIEAEGRYPVVFAGRNTHVAQAKGHGVLDPAEIEANISLIAAAPSLLKALKRTLDLAIGHACDARGIDPEECETWSWVQAARKAIADAED